MTERKPTIIRTTYQKGFLTGWTEPAHYQEGAILQLLYKDDGPATERSILIRKTGDYFELLPAKSAYWEDKKCYFLITPERNIMVAISAAEGVLLDESLWFQTEPSVV